MNQSDRQSIGSYIGMSKTCSTIKELRDKVAPHYGKEPVQLSVLPQEQRSRQLRRPYFFAIGFVRFTLTALSMAA